MTFRVWPALHVLTRFHLAQVVLSSDDALREYLFRQLTELVKSLRQHVRKFLPDLIALVEEFWQMTTPLQVGYR